jgi:hypothetical protein
METSGLLFIPDISGFTRFVTETEIDHSRRLIQELLEVVIDANQIGLEVSEVEGDAVLFFRFGACPDLGQICAQVERMFRDFHERLEAYEIRRFCQCRACVSASNLTLKIITHYGEFTNYSVRQFNKLFGRDVILAHRLLKNGIDHHEYWLATAAMLPDTPPGGLPAWITWNRGVEITDAGEIAYHFTPLSGLRGTVSPPPMLDPHLPQETRLFSLTAEYDTHIIALFHATGNFTYRARWQEGVRSVEEVSHYLPRVGSRCRRVMDDGQVTVYASSYSFRPDRIVFSETDEDRTFTTYFTLEAVEPNRTRLTIDHHVNGGGPGQSDGGADRPDGLEDSLRRSMVNLAELVKELKVSAEY